MLSREEIEQMIDQKIEPLTEEIAALKAQLGKVDLLAVDNRNIRQSLGRIETAQESLKLDFERQEKRIVHFERQTNEQFTNMNNRLTNMDNRLTNVDDRLTNVDDRLTNVDDRLTNVDDRLTNMDNRLTNVDDRLTNVQADTAALKEQLALVVTMLRRVLPPEEQR